MITISLCYSDVPKSAWKQAQNGKFYGNFIVSERREVDKYGNTHSVAVSQSKEEREAKMPTVYVGNGKEWKPQQPQQFTPPPAAVPGAMYASASPPPSTNNYGVPFTPPSAPPANYPQPTAAPVYDANPSFNEPNDLPF